MKNLITDTKGKNKKVRRCKNNLTFKKQTERMLMIKNYDNKKAQLRIVMRT